MVRVAIGPARSTFTDGELDALWVYSEPATHNKYIVVLWQNMPWLAQALLILRHRSRLTCASALRGMVRVGLGLRIA